MTSEMLVNCTRLRSATTQKTAIFILAALRTSNPAEMCVVLLSVFCTYFISCAYSLTDSCRFWFNTLKWGMELVNFLTYLCSNADSQSFWSWFLYSCYFKRMSFLLNGKICTSESHIELQIGHIYTFFNLSVGAPDHGDPFSLTKQLCVSQVTK
jgi:hypothetical protein